jgi:GT2 family glycosyltransferase
VKNLLNQCLQEIEEPSNTEIGIDKKKVSVIILNFNGKKYLDKCLETITNQTYSNYEVIVFDNASYDNSVEYVKKFYPWIKIIRSDKNLGYAQANNEAVKQVNGDFILFLNPDTWSKRDLLEMLVSTALCDPAVGACACMQLSYDGKFILNSGLATDIFGFPIPKIADDKPILYADGASLFVRRSLFLNLGGFDSAYFMYGEDIDLCWRILLTGYDVVSVKSAIIGHNGGGTVILPEKKYRADKKRAYLASRNSLRTALKNYSISSLFFVLPLRCIVTAFQSVAYFLRNQPCFVEAEIKAITWNFKNLEETFALRVIVQKNRRIVDKRLRERMSKTIGIVNAFVNIKQKSAGLNWEKP